MEYKGDYQDQKLFRFLIYSLAIHILIFILGLVFVFYSKEKPIEAPQIIQLVSEEKPKIRPIQPKVLPPEPEEVPQETPPPTEEPISPADTPEPPKKTEPKPLPKTDSVVPSVEPAKPAPPPPEHQMYMAESADPRLAFWIKRVKKIMESRWNPPRGLGILGVVEIKIAFSVNREGQILKPRISASSGNRDLDNFALETVVRVAKLPPIPPNFTEKDELDIAFSFAYAGE